MHRNLTPHTWMHRKSSFLRKMHKHPLYRYPIPHTWEHRDHHPSSKCKRISLKHECTEIIIPQMHQNLTPHTWMHWNCHYSGKCTDILPLTHECTEIIIPQVNAPESYPSHMNATQIVTPQVNAPISYPSHMNAPKSPSLKWMHRSFTPHT